MISKYWRIFLMLISLVLILTILLYMPASKIESIEYRGKSGKVYTYFTGEKFGVSFLGKEEERSFFPPKLLKLARHDELKLNFMNNKQESYVLAIGPQSVTAYMDDGQFISYNVQSQDQEIMNSFVSDFDNDGWDELFLLLRSTGQEYGCLISALAFNGEFYLLFKEDISYLNPWKVQVCDVDGDGEKEISLGVYTKSMFHHELAKRPFIYNIIEGKLYPKWLGSRLSRPFEDYVFADVDEDGTEELIALEILQDGKKELNSYKWKGFGFESIGNSKEFQDINFINTYSGSVSVRVMEDDKWHEKSFKYFDGMLIE